jgi:hypothetical protein
LDESNTEAYFGRLGRARRGTEHFAVLQNNFAKERSMLLLLYDKAGEIAYQEILGESCHGIATLTIPDADRYWLDVMPKFGNILRCLKPAALRTRVCHRAIDNPRSHAFIGNWLPRAQPKETLVLTSLRSRAILGSLDSLVDIGVPAEKEVIQ